MKRHTYDACSLARWVKSCLKPQGTELREAKMSTSVFTFACEFHEERFAFWLLEQLFFVLDSKENCFFPISQSTWHTAWHYNLFILCLLIL